jgi:L,D-transpeptidase ErfK/SrfK
MLKSLVIVSAILLACSAQASVFDLPQGHDSIIGELTVVTTAGDNTLVDVARHFDVGYDEITLANPGIDVWVPKPEDRIVVPTQFILPPKPWTGVVLNIAQRRMFYFPPARKGETPKVHTFPLGIAREDWSTPLGQTVIKGKHKDPAWFVPKSIQQEHLEQEGVELPEYFPPGPNNPMGMLAVALGFKSIFIHGTNRPWGVGMRVSHGCLHLYPEDAQTFFDMIPVNTPVRVINEPVVTGRKGRDIYVTFYRPVIEYGTPPARHTELMTALIPYLQELKNAGLPLYDFDWDRMRVLTNDSVEGLVVPTPVTRGTPDIRELLSQLPVVLYNFPPYGYDANDARVPQRELQ